MDKGVAGQWEEVREDDYYQQNSIAKLSEDKRKEFELKGVDSKAWTLEEMIEKGDSESESSDEEEGG